MNFLPGWHPGFIGGGTIPLTVAFHTHALAFDLDNTVTGPATIIAGDLLVLIDGAQNDSAGVSAVVPSGFTSINSQADASWRFTLSYKIATGAEASANLTGLSADLETLKTLLVFRPSRPLLGVTVGSTVASYTSGNPTPQVITASAGALPLIVVGTYQTAGVEVNPRVFSTTPNAEIQNNNGVNLQQWIAYKIYSAAPADTTIDQDDEGQRNCLIGCYFALTG